MNVQPLSKTDDDLVKHHLSRIVKLVKEKVAMNFQSNNAKGTMLIVSKTNAKSFIFFSAQEMFPKIIKKPFKEKA